MAARWEAGRGEEASGEGASVVADAAPTSPWRCRSPGRNQPSGRLLPIQEASASLLRRTNKNDESTRKFSSQAPHPAATEQHGGGRCSAAVPRCTRKRAELAPRVRCLGQGRPRGKARRGASGAARAHSEHSCRLVYCGREAAAPDGQNFSPDDATRAEMSLMALES